MITNNQIDSGKVVRKRIFSRMLRNRSMTIGFSLVMLMVVIAIIAPIVSPFGPMDIDPNLRLKPPNKTHIFGTDNIGQDVFSRALWGSRISLLTGFLIVLTAGSLGIVLGLIAGYSRSFDAITMRILDGLMAFPTTLLAIALMAVLGARLSNVIIALAIVYTPSVTRVVRSVVLVIKETEYIEAARSIGNSNLRIILKHILPNCMAPIIVQGSFIFAQSILAEAALSFLGVGVPPWIPSWGSIMTGGRLFINVAPWIIFFPGLFVLVTVLGLNLFGDGLRDVLDPRLRGL